MCEIKGEVVDNLNCFTSDNATLAVLTDTSANVASVASVVDYGTSIGGFVSTGLSTNPIVTITTNTWDTDNKSWSADRWFYYGSGSDNGITVENPMIYEIAGKGPTDDEMLLTI